MANDKIVVATVAFVVPGELSEYIMNSNTLFSIEMLVLDIIKRDYYRVYSLNISKIKIEAIMNADNPDTDLVDMTDLELLNEVSSMYNEES